MKLPVQKGYTHEDTFSSLSRAAPLHDLSKVGLNPSSVGADIAFPDSGNRSRIDPAAMNGRHHTHHNVIFKTKPERRIGRLDASLVLIAVHDLPPHRTGLFQGFGERFRLRRDQEKRTEIGIGLLLLCGHLWTTVLDGIGHISPQRQDRHKGRRVLRIGCDVMDRRDVLGLLLHLPGNANHESTQPDCHESEQDPPP